MGFLKRLSDTIRSYVSPTKPSAKQQTPQTEPRLKKPSVPARSGSFEDVIRHTRSMSPAERVTNWRVGSSSVATDSVLGNKRKRTSISAAGANGRKARKMTYAPLGREKMFDDRENAVMEDAYEDEDEGALEDEEEASGEEYEDEGYGDEDDISSRMSAIGVAKSPTPEEFMDGSEDLDVDETLVVSEHEYEQAMPKRKMIDLTAVQKDHHVSSEELRAQGWDDEHITMVQRIAMRGYEPLLPLDHKFALRYLPDALFAGVVEDAFISSVRGNHPHGEKFLEKLFELGPDMRCALTSQNGNTPEKQVRKHVLAYTKFVNKDADFDLKTAIPLLETIIAPANTPATALQRRANRKLAKLTDKWREALLVARSVENSPSSKGSTQYSYPLPTLYGIIATHTLVALVAYRPEDQEPDIKTVAFFDFKDSDYDVWNSLALAIAMNHARNVQLRIAEETGLGLKIPGQEEAVYDPDI